MKRTRFLLVWALVLVYSVLLASVPENESELKIYLDQQEAVFEDISVQMGIANWNVYSQEGEADQDTPKQRYFELFTDEILNKTIDEWMQKAEKISDPVLKRRVEVWHQILTGAKVDMNEEIFKMENRLEAWIAGSDTTGKPSTEEMDAMVLDLMKMRNTRARELGYDNYAVMILELTDLGAGWFESFIRQIDEVTREPYLLLLEEAKGEKEEADFNSFRQMLMQYFAASRGSTVEDDQIIPVMKESLENIGIDYDALPVRFVEKQIPYGGNGLAIQIPSDFRIVVNIGTPISTWMHELGHGLQGVFTETEYPVLKGYEWCLGNDCNAYAEGMAETCARFTQNDAWRKKYIGVTQEDIDTQREVINKFVPAAVRFTIRRFMFEVEMYKDLDQDLRQLQQQLDEHWLMIASMPERPVQLSTNIMYTAYPVYMHNYLIADLISWQVHETLKEKFGKDYAFNRETGPYIRENLLKQGEFLTWQEKLIKATGRELDVEGYLKSFGL